MNTIVNKELLFSHFDGRTTPLQVEMLRQWLHTLENQQLYYGWLQEWEHQHPQLMTDADVAFAQFQRQIGTAPQPAEPHSLYQGQQGWLRSYLIAASIAALLLMAGYLTRTYWAMKTIATDYGEVRSVVLDDGSRVTLNANSALQIPRFSIGTASRNVYLRGEAEFAIVHTASHDRFRVHTANGVEVIVLGTEFVVNTRRNNTHVMLNRGKVQLRYPTPHQMNSLVMKPGDWVNLQANKPPKRGRQPVEPYTAAAWKDYQYTFRQTPLPEIVRLIADNFGLTVQLDDALLERKVTGTFHAQNADEFVQALADLFDLSIIHRGKTIQLVLPDSVNSQQ